MQNFLSTLYDTIVM